LPGIEDPERLLPVGAHVALDLLRRHRLPRLGLPRRIADAAGEVPYHEDRGVSQLLELPQLPQHDSVPERELRGGRVNAELDPQWPPLAERPFDLLGQFVSGKEGFRVPLHHRQLSFHFSP